MTAAQQQQQQCTLLVRCGYNSGCHRPMLQHGYTAYLSTPTRLTHVCQTCMQALECFQKANEAAGGNADYTARIKVLKQKTSSQQKVAKVRGSSVCPRPLPCMPGPFSCMQSEVSPSWHACWLGRNSASGAPGLRCRICLPIAAGKPAPSVLRSVVNAHLQPCVTAKLSYAVCSQPPCCRQASPQQSRQPCSMQRPSWHMHESG
jgi:hypothetical protein